MGRLVDDLDGLSKDVRKLQEHMERLPDDFKKAYEDDGRNTDNWNNMHESIISLPEKIGKICSANGHGHDKMGDTEELKNEMIGMRNKNDILAAKVRDLQKDISGLPTKFIRLCSDKAGYDVKINDIHARVADLPDKLQEICSESMRDDSRIKTTLGNTKLLILELQQLQDGNADLHSDIAKLQTSVTKMGNEVGNVSKSQERQSDMFSNWTNSSLCGKENTASDAACDLRKDYADFTSKSEHLFLNATPARIPDEVITLLRENSALAEEISNIRKQLECLPNAATGLQNEIDLLKNNVKILQCAVAKNDYDTKAPRIA